MSWHTFKLLLGKRDRNQTENHELSQLWRDFHQLYKDLGEIFNYANELNSKRQRGDAITSADLATLDGKIRNLDKHDHLFLRDIANAEHTVHEEVTEVKHVEHEAGDLSQIVIKYNQIRQDFLTNHKSYSQDELESAFKSSVIRIGVTNMNDMIQRKHLPPKLNLVTDGKLMGIQISFDTYAVLLWYQVRALDSSIKLNGIIHSFELKGSGKNFTASKPAILKWGVHKKFQEQLFTIEEKGELSLY